MSSSHLDFDGIYLDRTTAHRPAQTLASWDRLQQPSIVISGLIFLLTFLYHTYGSSIPVVEDFVHWSLAFLWDALVFVTPLSLIQLIDSWVNPSRPMLDSPTTTNASKSDMMRTALGLDRAGGMMFSVFNARNRALSITGNALGFKQDSQKPPGLGNHDNSCFQNSILQGLASLKQFPSYLSACLEHVNAEDDPGRVVTQTLRALISDLNDASNNGRTLWTPSTLKFMSTWTQQDAQEYYSKILDDIDKAAAKTSKALKKHRGLSSESSKDDTTASQLSDDSGYQSLPGGSRPPDSDSLRNPLEGLLAQRVACVQCGFSEGLSMIPFNCLTLSLSLDRNRHDLYERLDAYSEIESISGVECPKCTLLKAQRLLTMLVDRLRSDQRTEEQLAEPLRRLRAVENALEEDLFDDETINDECKISSQGKVTTTKTKQVVIARPPQSLAIHVNRSVFDPSTFDTVKNSAPVDFPTTLDLGPWCLGSAATSDGPSSAIIGQGPDEALEERWQLHPRASMVAGDASSSRLCGPIYELRSVVTHYGRHENGHYICYRRHPYASDSPAANSKPSSTVDGDRDDVDEHEQDEALLSRGDSDDSGDNSTDKDWWRLSDHNVSKVDEETISSLSPGVFMLFYECIDPSMVLQETLDAPSTQTSQESVEAVFDAKAEPPAYSEVVEAGQRNQPGLTNHVHHKEDTKDKPPEYTLLPVQDVQGLREP
jgi:ubiquitin carboxyl-terminal hydrolase 1